MNEFLKDDLPSDLANAIAQARNREPTPEMVARLVSNTSRLQQKTKPRQRQWIKPIAMITAIAAVLLLTFAYAIKPTSQVPKSAVMHSAITRVSLIEIGFPRIEQDLETAESQIAETAESLDLAAVRREVQKALEQYRF